MKAIYPTRNHQPVYGFAYACEGKTKYGTRAEAERNMLMVARGNSDRPRDCAKRGAYACTTCGGWHWGHSVR